MAEIFKTKRKPRTRKTCRTKEQYEAVYADVLTDFQKDPTQSAYKLAKKFGISDQQILNVLNRTGAVYDALTEPKRKEMGREMRLSFFRGQQVEQTLADAGKLTARDLRDLAVARGINAQHINLIEGMPTAIEVNVDVYREKFAQIAARMVQGAKLAGMLTEGQLGPPEDTHGDRSATSSDRVVEDGAIRAPRPAAG